MGEGSAPTGTVSFLFTDVASSTRQWEALPEAMAAAVARHDAVLRAAIGRHGGTVFSTAGDAFAAAFHTAADAVAAAVTAQAALADEPWPAGVDIRVRMGVHTGAADERDGDYFGPTLNRAARIMAAGHGGQVLLSDATAALLAGHPVVDLGTHKLKDLAVGERIWQLGAARFPPLRVQDAVPNNLPALRTGIIGREAAVEATIDRLERTRLLSLVGVGGVGKTTLAIAVAGRLAGAFADGVWFVDLAAVTEPSRVVGVIADAVGVVVATPSDPAAQLASLLATRSMLIVLDNCEHLLDAAADAVDAVLERAPSVRWLVTSRERLDLPGEVVDFVEPLDWSAGGDSPCAELLRARAGDLGVELGPDDTDAVVELCRRLDGLALAIELAAAHLVQMRPADLVRRLDRRFELLGSDRRGRRARRHASLSTVLADTWELLPNASAHLLERLAVFPAAFDVDAVASVAGDLRTPEVALRDLVTRALVTEEQAEGTRRFRLLESVKLFARERWGDRAVSHRDAHLQWIVDTTCQRTPEARVTAWSTWPAIDRLWDDIAAAMEHAEEARRDQESAVLFAQCAYWARNGGPSALDVRRWAERRLGRDPEPSAAVHLALALACLGTRSMAAMADAAEAGEARASETGESAELAMLRIVRAWAVGIRDPALALTLLDAAMADAEAAGHHALAAAARSNQGTFLLLVGRSEEAVALCRALLEDHRAGDYARAHSGILLVTALLVDDPAVALAELVRLRDPARTTGGNWEWDFPFWRAVLAAACGDAPNALAHLTRAEFDARRRYDDDGLPDFLLVPAFLAHRAGDTARLHRYLTAIRRHGRPTQGFPMTILFRRLVATLGGAPLGPDAEPGAFAEGRAWMSALAGDRTDPGDGRG